MGILIIDVGSSSVRALIFESGSALTSPKIARREHQFQADATCDAHQLRQLVENCVDDILADYPHPIQAVGMTTFVGNMLGVDDSNRPITPLYTYANHQSTASARILMNLLDNATIHQRTGCRIHTAYHPSNLYWLRETQSDVFSQVKTWLDFATYCYREWFGRDMPCSYSIASWSGLLNREQSAWDAEWLNLLGFDENRLPKLADYDALQQGLSSDYAKRWSALKNVPFYLAIGDGAGANIGSGGISPQFPVLTVGTTSAFRIITPKITDLASPLWSYRADKAHHLVGGSTNEGGNILIWAKNTFNLTIAGINNALFDQKPASHGLTALPLFGGERSPYFNESARGTIHGITTQTSPMDIIQALLEGVAFRLRIILDALNTPSDFILAGGGALHQSPAWTQIFADILARPLVILSEREVSAYGVYWLITHGGVANIPPIDVSHETPILPRQQYTSIYANLAHEQDLLYHKLYSKG
ncbi:MAG: FGGY family carbohydrate kinase [Anaerolineae bacterium]|nr:FGGY family carbohydrate kinase [Anaerolineae bacterium]